MKSTRSLSTVLVLLALALLLLPTFVLAFPLPRLSAQTQYVAASPGYINLGMNTTISVTAPAAGSYTVVILSPTGVSTQLTDTFTSAGQVQSAVFGVAASGFKSVVNQVGTYNVFVEQGATVASSTSFYATNKLTVSMDMVDGGLCAYIPGATRGIRMIPRFYIYYASSGGPVTNTDKGISINFTQPGNVEAAAVWDASAQLFRGTLYPNWNYTNVGPWNPTVTVSDAAGNTASYTYTGSPFVISPATLSTTIQLVDSKTNNTITSISSNENVTVYATITYPTNAEPVSGFVGPLDVGTRGGVVTGVLGYGTYNATSGSFNEKNSGQVATVAFSYTGANGIWKGTFNTGTLPTLSTSQTFQIVISSHDKASPPNTGSASLNVAPGAGAVVTSATSSHSSTSQSISTISSTTTVSTSTVTTTTTIPVWAYAGTTIALIIGVIVGFLARRK